MSFKENLLKKIRINTLAEVVRNSLGSPDSGKKLDKNAMRGLLEIGGFVHRKERDLDLYTQSDARGQQRIMVLGNELAFFRTTVEDVALRRSPTVKEMISIRNAVKILSDKDIVISKGADTLQMIRQECLDMLDLSFDEADLDEMVQEGAASLKNNYSDGVIETLSLFAELLEYQAPPRSMTIRHYQIFGAATQKGAGDLRFGPMAVYGMVQNDLKFIDEQVSIGNSQEMERIEGIIKGKSKASCHGPEVFNELKRRVIEPSKKK
jgi:hypothetical protein